MKLRVQKQRSEGVRFPLTPTLSRRERENRRPPARKYRAPIRTTTRTWTLPLPAGERRGEGKARPQIGRVTPCAPTGDHPCPCGLPGGGQRIQLRGDAAPGQAARPWILDILGAGLSGETRLRPVLMATLERTPPSPSPQPSPQGRGSAICRYHEVSPTLDWRSHGAESRAPDSSQLGCRSSLAKNRPSCVVGRAVLCPPPSSEAGIPNFCAMDGARLVRSPGSSRCGIGICRTNPEAHLQRRIRAAKKWPNSSGGQRTARPTSPEERVMERENRRLPARKSRASKYTTARMWILPLPAGEGWGEGKGSPQVIGVPFVHGSRFFAGAHCLRARLWPVPMATLERTPPSPSPRPSPQGRGSAICRCLEVSPRSFRNADFQVCCIAGFLTCGRLGLSQAQAFAHILPTGSRRYSRLETCATTP